MSQKLRQYARAFLVIIFCLSYIFSAVTFRLPYIWQILPPLLGIGLLLYFPARNTKSGATLTAFICAALALFVLLFSGIQKSAIAPLPDLLLQLPFLYLFLNWNSGETAVSNRFANIFDSPAFFHLCMAAAGCGVTLQILAAFNPSIWVDEAYSLSLVSHAWGDMISIAAADVHPPLYYIILKGCISVLHPLLPILPVICIAKLASCIPFIVLLITAATKVRRTRGNYVAGLWGFSLFAAPSLISQGVEIRMYGWAMLFVTLAYLWAYDIITRGRKRDWCLFTIAGLAAAYTHYYACIAVTPVYLLLLYTAIKKGRSFLLCWVLAAAVTVVFYLPWLLIFIHQAQNVSSDYWIEYPSPAESGRWIKFLWHTPLSFGLFGLALFHVFKSRSGQLLRTPAFSYLITGIASSFFILLVGLTATYALRPVFVVRYLYPGLACLWLAFILATKHIGKPQLKLSLILVLISSVLCHSIYFIYDEVHQIKEYHRLMQELSQHPHAQLITDNNKNQKIISTLTGKDCLSYDSTPNSELSEKVYPACQRPNIQDIDTLLQQESHPSYVLLIRNGKKLPHSLTKGSEYYVGRFLMYNHFDMYVIPATENGAEH